MKEEIRNIFADPRQVERIIRKVIDYSVTEEEQLRTEIQEYVVTEHIKEGFRRILEWIGRVSEDGNAETGAWVSGFYGSGKSSFTKYLGYALDRSHQIAGTPFVKYLADRIDDKPTAAMLVSLSSKMNAAVVMLDLATEHYGSGIVNVSDILYRHTLKWAGYCHSNSTIAEFELMLEEEGRYEEFCQICRELKNGREWADIRNKALIAKKLVRDAAARMGYGEGLSFDEKDVVIPADERARKIVDIVRRKSGKEHVFFIIDEVGQYLAAKPGAILDMDGLAKTIRNYGGGKVFIIATAQQTLTEDNQAAAINSTELFKLKDRFPMSVTLESSDIEEICYQRLLKKSAAGKLLLEGIFGQFGPGIVAKTKLHNCNAYEANQLNKTSFVNQYPFIPSQFKILLSLLSELSRATGGIGLRSAIKVVQDIMISGDGALLNKQVGTLVTAENFYDELRLDIEQAEGALSRSANRAVETFQNTDPFCARVAKVLAVAQLLKDMEASPKNLAALLQDGISDDVTEDLVSEALKKMASDPTVPVAEEGNGTFHYLSQKQEEMEKERRDYRPPQIDKKNLLNDISKEVFSSVKSVQTRDGLNCQVELKRLNDASPILNPNSPLKLVVALYEQGEDERTREECMKSSLQNADSFYLMASRPQDLENSAVEILKCRYMAKTYGQSSDKEVREYAADQNAQAERLGKTLEKAFEHTLKQGEFVVCGSSGSIDSMSRKDFAEDVCEQLKQLAARVYSKHSEVSVYVKAGTAIRILNMNPNKPVDPDTDPLQLIQLENGAPVLANGVPALQTLGDILGRTDGIQGKALFDKLKNVPYGWAPDAVLYLLAAMFWGKRISLNISGTSYETRQKAVEEAFKNPKSFVNVGIRLRSTQISLDDLLEAGNFLSEFGIAVRGFTEDEIAAGIREFSVSNQTSVFELVRDIRAAGCGGFPELNIIQEKLRHIEMSSVSEFIRMIKESSELKERFEWLMKLKQAKKNGLFETIERVREVQKSLGDLPAEQRAELQAKSSELNEQLKLKSFYEHASDCKALVTAFEEKCRIVVQERMAEFQSEVQKANEEEVQLFGRFQLTDEERETAKRSLPVIPKVSVADSLGSLNSSLLQVKLRLEKLHEVVQRIVSSRRIEKKVRRTVQIPHCISDADELDRLIQELRGLKYEMNSISEIEISLKD